MFHVHLAGKGVESLNEGWNVVFVIMCDGVTVTPLLANSIQKPPFRQKPGDLSSSV